MILVLHNGALSHKLSQGNSTMTDNHVTEEPTVLYKYVSAERAHKVLLEVGNEVLRATQPIAMNDPIECASYSHAFYSSERVEIFKFVKCEQLSMYLTQLIQSTQWKIVIYNASSNSLVLKSGTSY